MFTLPSICGEAGAFDNFDDVDDVDDDDDDDDEDDDEEDDFDCEFSVVEMLFGWKIGCDCC